MNNKNKSKDENKRKKEIEFRILASKGNALLDHEIIETFLSAVHDRAQARAIAKNLVTTCTGIGRILGREMDELKSIEGVRTCTRSQERNKVGDDVYGQRYMRNLYPSDINREQFEKIRPILESSRKKTKPRKLDLYDVFCGVLYILKSACQWRMLPKDFPKWRSCYDYFKKWSEKPSEGTESILERVLKKISWRGPYWQWEERENQLLYN